MACRVSYWLDIPVVTPGILQQLQKEIRIAGSNHDLTPSHASRSLGAADAHIPPAVEIGIAKSGQLAIASAPALPEAPGHAARAELQLAPDLASLDTEPVLLQATAANARIQLGESLQSSLHMQVTVEHYTTALDYERQTLLCFMLTRCTAIAAQCKSPLHVHLCPT